MNQWKSAHAVKTDARTLADAMDGADAVFGLSAKGALTPDMVRSMAPQPIIFAMANPDPEITPEEVAEIRDDAIMATGRSDYPNQVNNVLGFPYIFRGALDVRATTINMEMKIAAARRWPNSPARTCPTRWPPPIRARGRASGRIHHPRALRSAPDLGVPPAVAQGGDGFGRRAQADRRRRNTRRSCLAPGAIRSPRRCSASSSACAASPSASSSPRARRSR
jgi:malate dehydrogenase (oxaloacetate-decarboxylating)(NADP+)